MTLNLTNLYCNKFLQTKLHTGLKGGPKAGHRGPEITINDITE